MVKLTLISPMRSAMPMHNDSNIRLLEWDSLFFEKKIGTCTLAHGNILPPHICTEAMDACYDCLYVWSDQALDLQHVSQPLQHVFPSVQLTFTRELSNADIPSPDPDAHQCPAATPALYPLAVTAGAWSRFFLDTHFPHEKSIQLYHRWLENSFHGNMGDSVITIGPPEKPIGLITVKKIADELHVGLVSVDSAHRQQGVGSRLLLSAIRYAYTQHCKRISVTTQEQNTAAIALYTKHDLHLARRRHVTHLWFT